MSASTFNKTTTTTENCVLHVTSTGTGSLLLILIPGGHGLCDDFLPCLPGLANNKYTVATYDRRGHGESRFTANGNEIHELMNPAQWGRDVLAIIKHMGFEKASVFGSSLGGMIALQFAMQYPQHVQTLIAHETPTLTLLPGQEGINWTDFVVSVYNTYKTVGPKKAMLKFLQMTEGWLATSSGKGKDIPPPQSEEQIPMDRDHIFWFEHEFIYSAYSPNLFELRKHLQGEYKGKMTVVLAVGEHSGNAPYAKTTYVQQEILKCPHETFPGGHLIYLVDSEAFVAAVLGTLQMHE